MQLDVEDVGCSLKYARAKVMKLTRQGENRLAGTTDADPWASTTGQDAEPPF
ncbi:MAG: hypothetical protein HOV83_07230 [Catenulispora sp.]|nr:hypothetical protein [Catenulispora sp.]